MPLTPEEEAQLAAEEAAGLFDHDSPDSGRTLLALPSSPEAVAWAAFVAYAREALGDLPFDLAILAWEGTGADGTVPTSAGETPWLRFTAMSGKKERSSTGNVWRCPILVHVDQITPGYNQADSMNLHSVLMQMVESSSFQAAMGEAGASSVWFDEGGYGERPNLAKYEPNPDGTITAIGTITIDLYVEYSED